MVLVPTVYLVDSDRDFIATCRDLFESHCVEFRNFSSPQEFIQQTTRNPFGCVVSEIGGTNWSGTDLCRLLGEAKWFLPVLIATGKSDVATCCRAFRAGISDFLEKPLSAEELWKSVSESLEECRRDLELRREREWLAEKLARLTDKEEAVARALVAGRSMKEIACVLGTSFQSVSRHRQRILHKFQVENDVALANLIRDCLPSACSTSSEFDRELAMVHD
jgi:two-component system CheB/CheR fusion protein